MPISNEGHPYRTPCAKCSEKDRIIQDEDKKIKQWRDAYHELVDKYDDKVKNDPDRIAGKWIGLTLLVIGLCGLLAWVVYTFSHLSGNKTAGLSCAVGSCIMGVIILWSNRVPKLKK